MEKRRRNILILLILLLLVVLLLFLFLRPKDVIQPSPVQTPVPVTAPVPSTKAPQVAPLTIREAPTPAQASAEAVARSFSERYGSFSAESNFANVRDLFPIMTNAFRANQESVIAIAGVSDEYYGISSVVLSLVTESMDSDESVIEVSMQRTEAKGSASNTTTFVETLRMELQQLEGKWLVNNAQWLE